MSCSSDRITELAPFLSDFRSKDELGSASDREESCAIRHAEKLSKVYSEAPFEDKREPDADCEQSDGYMFDIDQDLFIYMACSSHGITEVRVSNDFNLARYSSPSFGSQHLCSANSQCGLIRFQLEIPDRHC